MESVVAGKVVRDSNDLLFVLSEAAVARCDLKEGDELLPVNVENRRLVLELVRKAA